MIYIVKQKDGRVIIGSRDYIARKLYLSPRSVSRRIEKRIDENGDRFLKVEGFEYVAESRDQNECM